MVSFKLFFESNLPYISEYENKQVDKMVQQFYSAHNTPEKIKQFKDEVRKHRIKLGTIKAFDQNAKQSVDIDVLITRLPQNYYTTYDRYLKKENVIVINYLLFTSNLYNPEDVAMVLKHEIRHGVQQYKKETYEYGQYVKRNPAYQRATYYYLDPAELDAQEAEIRYRLNYAVGQMKRLNPKQYRTEIARFKNKIMKFIRTPWNRYRKEQLPAPLLHKRMFLKALSTNPKYLNKFKHKLYTYIQDISDNLTVDDV